MTSRAGTRDLPLDAGRAARLAVRSRIANRDPDFAAALGQAVGRTAVGKVRLDSSKTAVQEFLPSNGAHFRKTRKSVEVLNVEIEIRGQ